MASLKSEIQNIELSLQKERISMSKIESKLKEAKKQRLYLKNKAKIVVFSEYKQICKEIVFYTTSAGDLTKKIDELLIKYEKYKRSQKS